MKAQITISKQEICEMVRKLLVDRGFNVKEVRENIEQNYDECIFLGVVADVDAGDLQ